MTRLTTRMPPPPNGPVTVTRMPDARYRLCERKLFFRPDRETAEAVLSAHSTREHRAVLPGSP